MTENHFATLGLKAGAKEDEIKKAFHSLAKTWHPDKNKNAGAEQKFKEIVAAYQYLQSKDRREILERELNKKQYPPQAAAPVPNTTPGPNTTRKPASKDTTKKPSQKPDPRHSQENWKKDTSQKKSPHWSDSFRNTKNKKCSQGSDWKPWNTRDWADDFDDPTASPISGFSAAFSGFRTLINNFEKELESFLGKGSQFTDIFETVQPKFKKPMQPRFVAAEHGYSGGLDEEYLFSPHTAKNGKTHKDSAPFSDDDRVGSFEEDIFQHSRNQDWRSIHQDVLNKIREDRKAYQSKLKREASEEHGCEWCGQKFTLRALDRHVPICKEHVKRYGKPKTQHSFCATHSQKSPSFTMEKETGTPKATRPSSTCASDSNMTSDDSSPTPQRRPQSGGNLRAKSKTTKTSFSKEKQKIPPPSETQAGERSPGSYDPTQETNRQRDNFPSVLKGRQFPATRFQR